MSSFDYIDRLMQPRSIAILGCSESNAGGTALSNLLTNEFPGPVFPVHPKHETVLGCRTYPSLDAIPADVDCCIVALRAELVLEAVDQMFAANIKAAVILASGFAELGEEGAALQAELSRRLEKYEIAACGPNCLGLVSLPGQAAMYYAGIDIVGKRGPISFVSHSGSSCIALTNAERGSGFSYVISCGNEAGISVPDYVRFLAEDEGTRVIALHLEAVRDPAGLASAAAFARSKNKPIVVLKLGRTESGQRTAAAHSGALASPHAMAAAFFERHGMILVGSLDELQETCELLDGMATRLPTTPAVALTAVSGGMAGLSADIGTESGVEFASMTDETRRLLGAALSSHSTPGNPLDVTLALHDVGSYRHCLEILDDDPTVGLLVVCQGAEPGLNRQQRDLYAPIAHMLAELSTSLTTPIMSFSPIGTGLEPEFNAILRSAGVPQLMGATPSLLAVRHLMEWRGFKLRDQEQVAPPQTGEVLVIELGTDPSLSEARSKELLASYGIPAPYEVLTDSGAAAVAAAEKLGYPVVMKVDTPDIAHKTEAGIIALRLQSPDEVLKAFDLIRSNARRYDATARINGVSVQECVRSGVEMMVGIKNDPTFGPAVIVGAGGIHAEILDDAALRLAPVDEVEAGEMLRELRCYPLLQGFRGSAPADEAALISVICSVSKLAIDFQQRISELDINPLVVLEQGSGVRALDALVVQL